MIVLPQLVLTDVVVQEEDAEKTTKKPSCFEPPGPLPIIIPHTRYIIVTNNSLTPFSNQHSLSDVD